MGDVIRALTEMAQKLGTDGMVVVAAIIVVMFVGFAAYYVVRWNERLVNQVLLAQDKISNLAAQVQNLATTTIERNTVANNANTESNLKLCNSVEKLVDAFGSDPTNVCKFDKKAMIQNIKEEAKRQGITLTEDVIERAIAQRR